MRGPQNCQKVSELFSIPAYYREGKIVSEKIHNSWCKQPIWLGSPGRCRAVPYHIIWRQVRAEIFVGSNTELESRGLSGLTHFGHKRFFCGSPFLRDSRALVEASLWRKCPPFNLSRQRHGAKLTVFAMDPFGSPSDPANRNEEIWKGQNKIT